MFTSSFAVLALSAAVANPFTNLVHMHPRPAQADSRIHLTLYNNTVGFRDVTIDGHTYTVLEHHTLQVKAPAGTVVYAGSRSSTYHRGDTILEVTPKLDHQTVNIN